jgi:nucleotide-binding universal stress UspA family protein
MIKRILISVDFSETSNRAARWAIELADQVAGEALIVTILDVGDLRVAMNAGLHGFENDEEMRKQVREWIERKYSELVPAGAKNVRHDVRRGRVENELVDAIRQYNADLVVMGSTGMGKRLPLGSKTEYIMRHSNVPMVVVPEGTAK